MKDWSQYNTLSLEVGPLEDGLSLLVLELPWLIFFLETRKTTTVFPFYSKSKWYIANESIQDRMINRKKEKIMGLLESIR